MPVFPVIPFDHTTTFMAYPGTVSPGLATLIAVARDALDSLATHGFKRILIVDGQGSNAPIANFLSERMGDHPNVKVKFNSRWNAHKTWGKVQAIDPLASHASCRENFPFKRILGVTQPQRAQPGIDYAKLKLLNPQQTRTYLGYGNFASVYQKLDAVMAE